MLADHALLENRLYPSTGAHGPVAHEVGRKIVSGEFAEGELLPHEAALAGSYGVSRQAVREALKVLAAKGLVASRRRAGTRVLPRGSWYLLDPDVLAWHRPETIPASIVRDLLELRLLIEPLAAEKAATRGTPETVERIGAALAATEASEPGSDAFYAADAEFHLAVCAASGNELIERLSNLLMPLCASIFRLQGARSVAMDKALVRHRDLHGAIAGRDPVASRRILEELVAVSHRELADLVASALDEESGR